MESEVASPMQGRVTVRAPFALAAASLLVCAGTLAAQVADASGTRLKVDRQDSQADTPVNPYSDADLHVAYEGGSQTQHAYVHVSFASLVPGSTIDSLVLTLAQSASTTGNVQPQNAAIEACPLTTELPATYDASKAPQPDCTRASSPGEADGTGGWRIDLQPLVDSWNQLGNTGAAILAVAAPLAVGSAAGPTANNWALAFDPTRTTADATVTLPGSSSETPAPVPLTVAPLPPAAPATPALPPALLPSTGAPAPIPPQPPPAQAPDARAPAASNPAAAQPTTPAALPSQAAAGVSRGWIVAAVLLALAAATAVAGAGVRQVALRGSVSAGALLASLGSARSKLATPVALLALSSVLAVGFAGRMAVTGASGPGATVTTGGPEGGSGSASVATPGATGAAGVAGPGAPSNGAAGAGGGVGAAAAAGSGAGSGLAAGSGGSAGSGSAAAAPGGPLPRGVTPTTVRIGFFVATNQNTVNNAAGLNGLNNTGDAQAQATALVKWVNAHGGIAGHAIDPRFIPEDASNTDPNYPVQLCHQAVDDAQVFAVIDSNSETENVAQCYVSSHTLLFNEGLAEFSASTQNSWGAYYWSPSNPSLDRSMAEELDGLQAKGFFTKSDKVGYMYADEPSTHASIDRIVSPRLARLGYDTANPNAGNGVVSVGITPPVGEPNNQSAINNAMLKMKTSGVTKMFFVNDGGGTMAVFGMRDADNLQYHTVTYGLQSQDGPDALAYLEPSDQLAHAIAVGYWPWADTSTANSDGFPGSTAESQCLQIMNNAGIATPNPPGRDGEATAQMEQLCDGVFMLYHGAQGLGQNLSAPAFAAAAERLGTSYQNSLGYSGNTVVGPGHHDGNDTYRTLHWDPSCTNGYDGGTGKGSSGCFKLDSRTSYRSPEV
jgi:hypothetical protein